MRIQATVSPATSLGNGVWTASVSPGALLQLVDGPKPIGETSVILLSDRSMPAEGTEQLVFEPSSVRVLTIGRTNRAVFIYDLADSVSRSSEERPSYRIDVDNSGDDERLEGDFKKLPDELAEMARDLVATVRLKHAGRFQRTPKGKYVYRPNFWTIRVQPRDRSLAITVYGRGASLGSHPSLDVLPDQNSYSRFKISSRSQFDDAVSVIEHAAVLKNV